MKDAEKMENFTLRESRESPFHISLLPGCYGDQSTGANVELLFRWAVKRMVACVCVAWTPSLLSPVRGDSRPPWLKCRPLRLRVPGLSKTATAFGV